MDNPPAASGAPVIVLVADLIFASRIKSAASAAGATLLMVRRADELLDQPGRVLLVDLGMSGALEAAARWRSSTGAPAVGFISHVDTETAGRARAAGIDRVLPRSRFVAELRELLTFNGQ